MNVRNELAQRLLWKRKGEVGDLEVETVGHLCLDMENEKERRLAWLPDHLLRWVDGR